ncbi:MAG: hypothetical protein PHH13_01255 [Candidatus Peribacteraceae bacterium]|nr:hypothetical protein [Candidatus Peribacteraceae bacterium]
MSIAVEHFTGLQSAPALQSPDETQDRPDLDLLARFIVARAAEDPCFLATVPVHIRRHREWFRRVVEAVLELRPRDSLVLHNAPEFAGDNDLRRLADMSSRLTEQEARRVRSMAGSLLRFDPDDEQNAPLMGDPITDESPASISSYPLLNGRQTFGKCDLCGEDSTIEHVITMTTGPLNERRETIRVRACQCSNQRLETEDPVQVLYADGHFVQ